MYVCIYKNIYIYYIYIYIYYIINVLIIIIAAQKHINVVFFDDYDINKEEPMKFNVYYYNLILNFVFGI